MPVLRIKSAKPSYISVFISFLVFLLLSFQLLPVFAQSSFEKTKEDYSIQLKKYNLARNDYLTKKANYSAFQTATAKKEAFESTKIYLTETNFLLANKLLVVREFGNTVDWSNSSFSRDEVFTLLDEETNYLQNNWANIQKTTSLEQLPPLALEMETRLETSILPKVDKSIGTYEIAKTESAHKKFKTLSETVSNFVNPRATDDNRAIVHNWQSEISDIDAIIMANIGEAKEELAKIRLERKSTRVNDVITATKKAKEELKRSLSLFDEILRII